MISEDTLKESENASSIRKLPKMNWERKGAVRLRLNALGDVQNTIHSRPANSGMSNTNDFVKSLNQSKVSATPRHQNENAGSKSTNKMKCEKIVKPARSESGYHVSTVKESDCDTFETHNHVLCEQAEQSSVTDLFLEYKFGKSQIENLTKSVKRFKLIQPVLKVPSVVPCADIEIPKEERCDSTVFCVNDILNDLVFSDVPAPIEVI